jgi:hypothetical protein
LRTIDEGYSVDLPAAAQSRYVSPAAIVPKQRLDKPAEGQRR